jgi:transposase
MKLHGNARLTPHGRALMCRRVRHLGWAPRAAAEAAGCSERTCYRWLARSDAGEPLTDRSSAPRSVPGRTAPEVETAIEQLRQLRHTSTRIAAELGLATSTVCAVLHRLGLNRLSRLEPPEPPNRYCRRHPGELAISTSRSSAGSGILATGSPAGDQGPTTGAPAGTLCTSVSMTPAGSPMSKSSPTRPPRPRSGSWPEPPRGSPIAASPSSGS